MSLAILQNKLLSIKKNRLYQERKSYYKSGGQNAYLRIVSKSKNISPKNWTFSTLLYITSAQI